MALEENFKKVCALDLNRLKGNCPSGYRCRTRHPQGPGCPLSRVLVKEGPYLKTNQKSKCRNEGKCSFTRRNATMRGEPMKP
jgi:hypothetical protein